MNKFNLTLGFLHFFINFSFLKKNITILVISCNMYLDIPCPMLGNMFDTFHLTI